MSKLNEVPLCGIKAIFWRDFLKAFQESTTDAQAHAALERLRRRVVETTELPSPKSQAALTILAELERLLEIGRDGGPYNQLDKPTLGHAGEIRQGRAAVFRRANRPRSMFQRVPRSLTRR